MNTTAPTTHEQAHDTARDAAQAAYMAIDGAERYQDTDGSIAFRWTSGDWRIVWGADETSEGDPLPYVNAEQCERAGDRWVDVGHVGCPAEEAVAHLTDLCR